VRKGALRIIIGMLALAVALVAVGCGGDSEEPLSEQEFKKQATAICKDWQKGREEAFAKLSQIEGNPTIAVKEEAILKILVPYEEATARLADLDLPDDGGKAEKLIESMEEAMTRVKADPRSAITGILPFKEANKAAEDYDLEQCTV